MSKQIINIINFVRGTEPRQEVDLLGTMEIQMKKLVELNLRGTFLFQYDALSNVVFVEMAKKYVEYFEFGLWIELTRSCVTTAGAIWHGRDQEWDWHGNICTAVGYDPNEREKMADTAMKKFKEAFGYYPKSVGAWAIDSVTLAHLERNYKISAACVCKEQWGTDGYTLWGGYYGQAYYPSKNHFLCPAQTDACQINIPVFRMLGSDPVYQYDAGLDLLKGASEVQSVVTLEPVYKYAGGGVPEWVDWYFQENFNGKCLSFGYAQAGQENSFGWEAMKDGWLYQMNKIKELADKKTLEVMTLNEAGEWYQENYKTTPPSAIVAENDWRGQGRRSYWYSCKNYRINLYFENDAFWIRDCFLFDEKNEDIYLKKACVTEGYFFQNQAVVDGNRNSGNGVRAGLFPIDKRTKMQVLTLAEPAWCDEGDGKATVIIPTEHFGDIKFIFAENNTTILLQKNANDFELEARSNPSLKIKKYKGSKLIRIGKLKI